MTFTPFVLGPDEIPPITDTKLTRKYPELGVLSAMIHGRPPTSAACAPCCAAPSA